MEGLPQVGIELSAAMAASERCFHEGRLAEALDPLDAAVAAGFKDAALQSNRCLVLQRLGRIGDALDAGRAAVALDPRMPAALANLAGALRMAGDIDSAFGAVDAALRLDPSFADAHAQRALLLQHVGQLKDAIDENRAALTLSADLPEAWTNIGVCLKASADAAGACAAYRRALAARPGFAPAWWNLLMCAQYDPALSASELRELALEWQRAMGGAISPLPLPLRPPSLRDGIEGRRLRVGYVSADFYEHPVGWFLSDVLRNHDHDRFDVRCYASQTRRDALTEEMMAAAHGWSFVGELTDPDLVRRIRSDGIDVLVDLSGHTAGNRLGVFALRAAPVQVSWLGYFASTGLAAMDAVLLAREQMPEGAQAYFTEKLLPLECCQFAYSPPHDAPEVAKPASRDPVFGSFNNIAKLNDEVLGAWSAILRALPASRLVLKWQGLADSWLRDNLLRRFANHGADPARIDLRDSAPHRDMLEEYADIDVALDPFPFSGALTTCEALWMGVPVVTLAWHRPVSRQSLSILGAIGLDDLAAATPREYVEIATRLAQDRERLSALRASLRGRMRASEIGNGKTVARELERNYLALASDRAARQAQGAGS